VIKEWLSDAAGVMRVRRQIAEMRRSQYARDLFREGYRTGYQKGRADEKIGAFSILEPDLDPPHPQVEVDGIEVDEGIRDLLVALWDLGLDTQYSCQGVPDKFSPHQSYSRNYASQIVFGNVDHAVKFMKKTAELLGSKNYSEGGVVLATMAPTDGSTPRAEVTFSPVLLQEITDAWVTFELTVPPAPLSEDEVSRA
jgi:hypothetical protein